jgi:hypothetical protein
MPDSISQARAPFCQNPLPASTPPPPPFGHLTALGRSKSNSDKHLRQRSSALTRPLASFWPGQKAVWPRFWRAGLATWQTAPRDWRAGLALARSFPREGARGKVLGGQSQNLVAYGLELREYFANLIANLAIWQSARSWRKPPSLHRCTSLRAMRYNEVQCSATTCNAVQRRAMQCNEVQCSAGGYVQCVQRATTAMRIGGWGCPGGLSDHSHWRAGLARRLAVWAVCMP